MIAEDGSRSRKCRIGIRDLGLECFGVPPASARAEAAQRIEQINKNLSLFLAFINHESSPFTS